MHTPIIKSQQLGKFFNEIIFFSNQMKYGRNWWAHTQLNGIKFAIKYSISIYRIEYAQCGESLHIRVSFFFVKLFLWRVCGLYWQSSSYIIILSSIILH